MDHASAFSPKLAKHRYSNYRGDVKIVLTANLTWMIHESTSENRKESLKFSRIRLSRSLTLNIRPLARITFINP